MRTLVRIVLGLVVLMVLAVVGLAVALPRLLATEAVRERLVQAGSEAAGAPVDFETLSVGLFPPRLVVTEPSLQSAAEGAPSLRAAAIDLEVALLPLLGRAVVVESLTVEGAHVRLVRTADGIVLPGPATQPEDAGAGTPAADEPVAAGEEPFRVALSALRVRDARIEFEDRSLDPPVVMAVEDLDAEARGRSLTEPIDVELSARLGGGGVLEVSGSARLDGEADLDARLEDVDVALAAGYAPAASALAGKLSGTVQARVRSASPSQVDADLVVEDADLRIDEMGFEGRLRLTADLEGAESGYAGPFEIDATEAVVAYGEFFQKPVGKQATAKGRLSSTSGGTLEIRDLHLTVQDFEAEGRLETGARTEVELVVPPFELAGMAPLFPTLGGYGLGGQLGVDALRVVPEPLSIDGDVTLAGIRVQPGEGEAITLDGVLRAQGTSVASRGLTATVGGEVVNLDARLDGLGAAPRYRLRADTKAADLQALLRAFGAQDDVISGPLTAQADLAGSLDAPEPLTDVRGTARLDVGRGTLRGVSLLEGTVERLGVLGAFAFALGSAKGGSSLQRFYGDEFESIRGSFRIGDGQARSEDLQLVYRHYQVDLEGSLGLLDTALDFGGRLTIHPEVDEALQGEAGGGREKVIPLAHVGGTLAEPSIELTREAVVALAASPKRGELEQKIDERLGEGTGREVLDALEGLLGGRKRP